jgi:hypothetical protein
MALKVVQASPNSLQGYGPGEPYGVFSSIASGGGSSPSNNDTSGYSGGSYYSSGYTAPDPYAQWGGKAGYDRAVADFGTQKNTTFNSINDRIGSEGAGYNSSILDFLDSTTSAQKRIDGQTVQNELAKRSGNQSVLDMIGHGLQSGGVMLANKNATTSSAKDQLARAYSDIGRRESSKVGNQYEQGKDNINNAQVDLGLQEQQGLRHLGEDKTKTINTIVQAAQDAISSLNSAAASASLPDRVDIEAKKQEVRNQALAQLQQYDATLSNGVNAIKPINSVDAQTKAAQLYTAGTAPENAFDFNTSAPAEFQGSGPFASELPIFTFNKKNDTSTVGV